MPDAKDDLRTIDWGPGSPIDEGLSGLDPVVAEAKKRFERAMKWEAQARTRWVNDYKFAEADSDNFWQWPQEIRRNRDVEAKPCLTVNKTRQHNLQIINDARQNQVSIKVSPTGNGATFEAAQAINQLFRRIEAQSVAQSAYQVATAFQVKAGLGYCRVNTRYVDDNSFDQEIFIDPVPDPLTVLQDPDIKQADGRDQMWAFVFEDIPRDRFMVLYPEYKDNPPPPGGALGQETDWINQNKIRVAEYFRKVQKWDTLYSWVDKDSQDRLTLRSSQMEDFTKEQRKSITEDPATRTREVLTSEIWWYKIIGEEVKEKRRWPGKFIPIARLIGEEVVIEGLMDRKGHTRALKDPQRMYNYWTSSAAEYGALQSKSPFTAAAAAIEGLETYWETANTENHSILPWNHLDDDGNPIPEPKRQSPPIASDAFMKGMQIAGEELMMASGQYQANMGQASNERSGKAINERQRQGDNSTYHFIGNQALMIKYLADICLDLFPHIYDTKRILRIQAEDGEDFDLTIDPAAKKAHDQKIDHLGKVCERVLNPSVGSYEVIPDIGPAYGTKRQEAFNAFSQIIAQNESMAGLVGDLFFKSGDFPLADEAAARLRRMLPPQATGQGPSAAEQQLQAQVQQLTGLLTKSMDELGKTKLKLAGKEELRDIEGYDAETKRISALQKLLPTDAEGMKALIHQLVGDALQTHITQIQSDNDADLRTAAQATSIPPGTVPQPGAASGQGSSSGPSVEPPPVPGAAKAPDGQWYVSDPTRPGKFARVKARAKK